MCLSKGFWKGLNRAMLCSAVEHKLLDGSVDSPCHLNVNSFILYPEPKPNFLWT